MRVYNKHHNDAPADAVYIGRGSPYGNPYPISKYNTREEVIKKFEENILPNLDIEPLRGKSLICFCAPKACHGDAIIRKLEATKTKFKF